MRGEGPCSESISLEHFISENLLERLKLNDTVKVAGLAWQPPQTFKKIGIPGFGAKILCSDHNHELSPLDAEVGALVRCIHSIDQTPSSVPNTSRFSGEKIEGWMLKCLLGMSTSKNISAPMKEECASILSTRTPWPEHWGLYFDSGLAPISHTESLLIETYVGGADNKIVLARFLLQGLPFKLLLGQPNDPALVGIWRPGLIRIRTGSKTKKIKVQWPDGGIGRFVELTRQGSYDGAPPNWQPWQRDG